MKKDMVAFGFVWFGDDSGKISCKDYYKQHDLKYIYEHIPSTQWAELLRAAKGE